ncbi:MAG TPA: chromosomal replication initiator protein DnaA [Firmicutes bacterium]|nr:chromosomal replication initiator protein DnaA [Candidatus Fermentithermobacillaceae bacterium]
MSSFVENTWEKVLSTASARLNNPSFERWLRETRPLQSGDGALTILVPSEFARSWIESKYKDVLASIWQEISGKPCPIRFQVEEPDKASKKTLFDDDNQAKAIKRAAPHNEEQLRILNPRYSFENFIVGASNRFAHAAALAVAESPAKIYNPLFIYSGVGLGKTHLMQAIAQYVIAHHSRLRVCYVSSETFTNDLITAIQEGSTPQFRNRYRGVDLLLIDDIQFVAGKEATQEELFHTFDALHQASKQLVISSDRPPKDIATLEHRLRTRFEWGLICDIQPPDFETRVAILRKKGELEGVEVPLDVCQYIAERIPTNIRELEGALIRVLAYSSLNRRPLDVALCREVLRGLVPDEPRRPVTIRRIQEIVASHYNIDLEDMWDKRRSKNVAFPRQVAMYLARQLTDASLPRIGEEFGKRDHTTVLHACEKIAQEIKSDSSLACVIDLLTKKLQES